MDMRTAERYSDLAAAIVRIAPSDEELEEAAAALRALSAENHRLSGMFMRAPHADFCEVIASFGAVHVDPSALRCTCWKADVL